MTELYRARVEADKLRASLTDAQAECRRMESQLDRMRSTTHKEVVSVWPPPYILIFHTKTLKQLYLTSFRVLGLYLMSIISTQFVICYNPISIFSCFVLL